jgi:hypothetical protein
MQDVGQCRVAGVVDLAMLAYVVEIALRRECFL